MHPVPSSSKPFLIAAIAMGAVALSFLAFVGGASAAGAACTPGVRTVDGSPARVFCGPAKATVHVGATTLTFKNGVCEKSGGGYVVNIGTFFAGTTTSKKPYFGLLISKPKAGKYTGQVLSFRSNGVSRSALATVTLKSLKSGTFSGKAFGAGLVTGSFTC